MGELLAQWDALMKESQTRGLDALHTLGQLALQIGRSYLEDPAARGAPWIQDGYQRNVRGDLPQPYAVWLERVARLLADGQRDGSTSPGLDCDTVARVVVASFYGVQDRSDRLHTRNDLLDRIDEWWAMLTPILATHNTCGQQRRLHGAPGV